MSSIAILRDTLVAPAEAFAALNVRSRWVLAMIVATTLGFAGVLLSLPAIQHITLVDFPRLVAENPNLSASTPEARARSIEILDKFDVAVAIFSPVATAISLLANGGVLFLASLFTGQRSSYVKALALSCNVGFVYYGLFNLVLGLAVLVRGANTYTAVTDVWTAIPCAAWLVPGATAKMIGALSTINPFSIWSFALTVAGGHAVLKLPYWLSSSVAALSLLTVAASVAASSH